MNKPLRLNLAASLVALLAIGPATASKAESSKAGTDASSTIGGVKSAASTSTTTSTANPETSGSATSKAEPSTSSTSAATNQTLTEASKSGAKSGQEPDVTAPKKVAKVKEDLPNFHEVHPFLYRGGEPNEAGLEKLKGMGIGTIIDLRAPSEMKVDEKSYAKKLGINYINLVMDSHAPTEQQVDTMMREIDKAKEASEKGEKNKALFLHCAHGSDRTGCMVGIYRVTHEKWDYPTAYTEMRKYWFTPKFVRLSGAVETYAANAKSAAAKSEK